MHQVICMVSSTAQHIQLIEFPLLLTQKLPASLPTGCFTDLANVEWKFTFLHAVQNMECTCTLDEVGPAFGRQQWHLQFNTISQVVTAMEVQVLEGRAGEEQYKLNFQGWLKVGWVESGKKGICDHNHQKSKDRITDPKLGELWMGWHGSAGRESQTPSLKNYEWGDVDQRGLINATPKHGILVYWALRTKGELRHLWWCPSYPIPLVPLSLLKHKKGFSEFPLSAYKQDAQGH